MIKQMPGRAILTLFAIIASINVSAMPSYDDVLVVVNDKSPQSLEIGEYFKTARKIPDINVCHISVIDLQGAGKEDASMSFTEKKQAVAAVEKHLADNNLTEKINYIVLTRGIPMYSKALSDTGTENQLFDLYLLFALSESAVTSAIPDVFTYNKYYYYILTNFNNLADYKFTQKKYGYYQVARLDGPGTVNIKKMIDSTGSPAYHSYKKPVKFLTMTPYSSSITVKYYNEIKVRGNISIITPDLKNGQIMSDVGQDIMFGYWNRVNGTYYDNSIYLETFAPYYVSYYYADSDTHSYYPNIFHDISFLPGSMITCFRSYPSHYNHRPRGGLLKLNPTSGTVTDYQKKDGSDIKLRHMSCVEYDPVNNWVWCGASDNALSEIKSYSYSECSADTVHKFGAGRGSGIGIFDKDGNLLNHLNMSNSPLANNRVVKIVYDKYAKLMWVAHYGGIQYYDLVNKTWSEVTTLKNAFAASCWIYVDSYDTDKVYFSFFTNSALSAKKRASSLIANAETSIFEYSKSAKTVKNYLIDATVKGIYPLIAKTSVNTLWVTKDINYLYKYDLSGSKVLEKIDIKSKIPEIASLGASAYVLKQPTAITAVSGTKTVLLAVSCIINSPLTLNLYVLRVTDNDSAANTVEVVKVKSASPASLGTGFMYGAWSLIADPSNADKFYISSSHIDSDVPAALYKSTDQGKTWSEQTATASAIYNLQQITVDPAGYIYAVRGYNLGQQNFSDFQAFGLCAWGGGLSHESFSYNPSPATAVTVKTAAAGAYASDIYAEAEAYTMMFMLLDGYYYGEARFSIFQQYPASGGGGYIAHMLCFEPKCAPYAPRVDEENLNFEVADKKTIEIPLRSPGLPLAMDSFIAATISNDTVSVKDSADTPVPVAVEYKTVGNKIVLTGDFSGTAYKVTLKCGVNGIKNIKGASLTNTRIDEFKDEVTYTFGAAAPEYYTPPSDLNGPVKMPAGNAKCDLIVNKVWWTSAPVIGQPLTVNFEISNIGTAKTAAGGGIQKAKVYLNNVLVEAKAYNDIPAKGKVALTSNIPGSSIVGAVQTKIIVWADATDKVAEIRETNNTNSASFIIETRPDLVIKETILSPKPKAKSPLTISFKISNSGAAATTAGAGVQVATVFVDGKPVGTVSYDDVPKGGSVVKQLVLPLGIATAGTHKVKVSADTNNAVAEIRELNNSLEKSFSIAK